MQNFEETQEEEKFNLADVMPDEDALEKDVLRSFSNYMEDVNGWRFYFQYKKDKNRFFCRILEKSYDYEAEEKSPKIPDENKFLSLMLPNLENILIILDKEEEKQEIFDFAKNLFIEKFKDNIYFFDIDKKSFFQHPDENPVKLTKIVNITELLTKF
jgi:hypothetical protein